MRKRIFDPEIHTVVRHTGWGIKEDDNYPCDVLIIDGQHLFDGRVSNFWSWRRVLPGGTLAEIEHGYGSFEESDKKYRIDTVVYEVGDCEKNKKMEKVIRDGRVAVLVSPGVGAGWYSWNTHKELLFHPKLVEMVEKNRANEIDDEWIRDNLGIENVYCGGAYSLKIHWLPIGTPFYIEEYRGSENLLTSDDFIIA